MTIILYMTIIINYIASVFKFFCQGVNSVKPSPIFIKKTR